MLTIAPTEFRKRRGRAKSRPATAPPIVAPTLIGAVYEWEEARVTLTFDRPVNVDGFDPLLLLVSDADEQGVRYEGSGVVTLTEQVVVRIGLAEIGASIGPGVTLTANAGAGIIAADNGAAWAGVTNLGLPFP